MRLAFVVPRYGQDVLGGAETAARQFAEHLAAEGRDVTVLTTCARDLHTWRNVTPAGKRLINGVPVWRFPVQWSRREARQHKDLTRQISLGVPTSLGDERSWVDSGPHSPLLYDHLIRYGHTYDLLIFVPYPFPLTYYGTAIHPERSVVWPCLHDEPFAWLRETQDMLASSLGLMFNCEPEMTLADRVLGMHHPTGRVVGIGVTPGMGDAHRFRVTYGIEEPFVLYVGRLDPMKNLLELFTAFLVYRQSHNTPLKLVLFGDGPLKVPAHPDILKLGVVSESSKWDAYAACIALCQPSLVESFSLTLMEAWLQGAPVIVHGHCNVTRYHVHRAQGGLVYLDSYEFAAVVDWLLAHPDERQKMGALGRRYVARAYGWTEVIERFSAAVEEWTAVSELYRSTDRLSERM